MAVLNLSIHTIENGVVTFSPNQLLTSSTSVIYECVSTDEDLRGRLVNKLISEQILVESQRNSCSKETDKLLQVLSKKTHDQLEKFFVILLGELEDAAVQESRKKIREEFTKVVLEEIDKTVNSSLPLSKDSTTMEIIQTVQAFYKEFSSCLVKLIRTFKNQIYSRHIEYSQLKSSSTKSFTVDLTPPTETTTVAASSVLPAITAIREKDEKFLEPDGFLLLSDLENLKATSENEEISLWQSFINSVVNLGEAIPFVGFINSATGVLTNFWFFGEPETRSQSQETTLTSSSDDIKSDLQDKSHQLQLCTQSK